MSKITSLLIISTLTLFCLLPLPSQAAYQSKDVQFEPQDPGVGGNPATQVTENPIVSLSGLGAEGPLEVTVLIINAILAVLALIFVSLIIYGGISWMLSGGNEETVTKAKNILKAAVIGLIIVFISYGATLFIFTQLVEITNAPN